MKKLDKLVLKSFIGPFILTFVVVVFILLLQYMLKYFDDLVGKGLGFEVFAELMTSFSIVMTPNALPLAVLLSSLMTFGNLGEHFELTAIKSSGISLLRAMAPIFYFAVMLTVFAFFSNNNIVPKAALNAYSLMYDVRQQKPALNIKEGAFYNGIKNFTIRVNEKDPKGDGMKDLVIYDHTKRKGNIDIIMADSGRMYSFMNDRYLVMELFDGHRYSQSDKTPQRKYGKKDVEPYMRTKFAQTKMIFSLEDFDLKKTKKELFANNRLMKNIGQLSADIDSMDFEVDEVKYKIFKNVRNYYSYHLKDRIIIPEKYDKVRIKLDSIRKMQDSIQAVEDGVYETRYSAQELAKKAKVNNEKASTNKKTAKKESDNKKTDRKKPDVKKSDTKKTVAKKSEDKKTDSKKPADKKAGEKPANNITVVTDLKDRAIKSPEALEKARLIPTKGVELVKPETAVKEPVKTTSQSEKGIQGKAENNDQGKPETATQGKPEKANQSKAENASQSKPEPKTPAETEEAVEKKDTVTIEDALLKVDSVMNSESNRSKVMASALTKARQMKNQMVTQNTNADNLIYEARKYRIEKNKKYALAIACLSMFLIGAPLGAIIKKGGLGFPVIISIIFFILFYVINITGEKLAKQGIIEPWIGAWSANFILFPIGLFFLRQARIDARLFDLDFYNVFVMNIKKRFTKNNKTQQAKQPHQQQGEQPDHEIANRELSPEETGKSS